MEQPVVEVRERVLENDQPASTTAGNPPARALSSVAPAASAVSPQTCSTCGTAAAANGAAVPPPRCVYAIGHLEPRFPSLSIEQELRQATARAGSATVDLTNRQAMLKVLLDPQNLYIVRQLCWVFLVQGVETYILVPRAAADYQLLLNAYRAEPNPGDLEVVIGTLGPIAPPTMCNGLQVPILVFDQIYFFDRESLLKSIPKQKEVDTKKFHAAAGEMFDRIISESDNAGASDADRTMNYLAMRYDRIYSIAAQAFANNASLASIEVVPSPLTGSGTRRIMEARVAFIDRTTAVVTKYFVRVDVTDCFPFLVTPLSPYYDR
jgi:hypothetical protein